MQHLRFWFVLLIVWFVGLYNMERYYEPIHLASFSYLFIAIVALAVLLCPWLQRVPLPRLLLLPLPVFLGLKFWLGYQLAGATLPVTVTEIVAIEVTIGLSRQIGQGLEAFRAAVTEVVTSQLYHSARPFQTGQADMYREVRRARVYHRPLALLAVSTDCGMVQQLNRFIEEMQRETVKKYVSARIARLLSEQTKDCDIITQRDDHFVALLPEMSRQEALVLMKKLDAAAKRKLGIELKMGVATFPDQEVTFEGLVERAEAGLWQSDSGPMQSAEAVDAQTLANESKEHFDADLSVQVIRLGEAERRHGTLTPMPAPMTVPLSGPLAVNSLEMEGRKELGAS